jgi:enolase
VRSTISQVLGRRVWDSRGRPTVEAEVVLQCGVRGRGIAPAGASRGRHEAVDLRDGGTKFGGFGVSAAVSNVRGPIADVINGMDASDLEAVDQAIIDLDGTGNKSRLGGNATIAVSLAVLNAAAAAVGVPVWRHLRPEGTVRMPLPQVQIFGGGVHAGKRTDIQDFLVMPVGAGSFDQAIEMCAEVYHAAGSLMDALSRRTGVADEGGWWPHFESNEEGIDVLARAIEKAGYRNGEVMIALDIAASELRSPISGRYRLSLEGREFETLSWMELLLSWVQRYPILSIEDPFAEDDEEGMRAFTAAVGERIQVIGDDLLVSNTERIAVCARDKSCNAVLLKPNQTGTLTETLRACERAKKAQWGTIVSARSGETEDVTIAHLAVGWDTAQLKVGSLARSERLAKWNEVLRIEEELGVSAVFAGYAALPVKYPSQ